MSEKWNESENNYSELEPTDQAEEEIYIPEVPKILELKEPEIEVQTPVKCKKMGRKFLNAMILI